MMQIGDPEYTRLLDQYVEAARIKQRPNLESFHSSMQWYTQIREQFKKEMIEQGKLENKIWEPPKGSTWRW